MVVEAPYPVPGVDYPRTFQEMDENGGGKLDHGSGGIGPLRAA
jgi:hypothetical protein